MTRKIFKFRAYPLFIFFLIIALMSLDANIQKLVQAYRTTTTNQISKIVKPLGEGKIILPIFLGISLLGITMSSATLTNLGTYTLHSLALNGICVGILQPVLGRGRPFQERGSTYYDPFKTGGSFPSGHTTVAFTVATVFSSLYKTHVFVPILSYSLATLVGLSRINDNKHFASDVLMGAIIGIIGTKLILRKIKDLQRILQALRHRYFPG